MNTMESVCCTNTFRWKRTNGLWTTETSRHRGPSMTKTLWCPNMKASLSLDRSGFSTEDWPPSNLNSLHSSLKETATLSSLSGSRVFSMITTWKTYLEFDASTSLILNYPWRSLRARPTSWYRGDLFRTQSLLKRSGFLVPTMTKDAIAENPAGKIPRESMSKTMDALEAVEEDLKYSLAS